MKIVFIGTVASSFYGFRSDLIHELTKLGHSVYAFTSEGNLEDFNKIRSLGAIPIAYQLKRGGLNPFTDIKSTFLLALKIKKLQPDLVFSYFAKPVIFGTLAAKLARVPKIIGMLEGLGYSFTEQPEGLSKKIKIIKLVQVLLYKITLPKLDKLILLNTDDRKDLLDNYSINVKNVEILGGIGLNLKTYAYSNISSTKNCIKFIFVGRLLKEKGIHDFVNAAIIVKELYPNTQFTILGSIDHSNLGRLKQSELDYLIDSGIINYPGQVDNVQEWIANHHVFVLPSYREGVPRSTQEAMAIGRPVITTDVPGCRETVIEGVNGFIVEKWDPKALAEKMIYFIENPEQIETMGVESYKIAQEKFDANKVNQRLLKMIEV